MWGTQPLHPLEKEEKVHSLAHLQFGAQFSNFTASSKPTPDCMESQKKEHPFFNLRKAK